MSERRVLFICTDNTCRGPMAEGIFNQMTEHLEGTAVKCASAGISAVKGQRVTPWAMQVCWEIGVDISLHRATYLTEQKMQDWDVLAVMTEDQYRLLLDAGAPQEKLVLLDVEDPYGGSMDSYRRCRDLLARRIRERVLCRVQEAV